MGLKTDALDDLALFLDTDEFGDTMTYYGAPVNCMLVSRFELTGIAEDNITYAIVVTTDIPSITQGIQVIINSITYTVIEVKLDNTGFTFISLSKDSHVI